MSRDDRLAEPIGAKLATLRRGITKLIPKAERSPPGVPTASDVVTRPADQVGPVEFARSLQVVNGVRSVAQRHEIRSSQVRDRLTTDRKVIIQAIEEAERILAGGHGAVATALALIELLDRREVVVALNCLKAGHGLRVVK
jgi:hypothetical protein